MARKAKKKTRAPPTTVEFCPCRRYYHAGGKRIWSVALPASSSPTWSANCVFWATMKREPWRGRQPVRPVAGTFAVEQ